MLPFLDKLQLVAHEPLAYVAFLAVLGAWLWRAYFLRTQAYLESQKALPERDRLSALQLLVLGYPQKLTANHLQLLRQRYLLVAFIASLVCVVVLAGLFVQRGSLPVKEVSAQLSRIEEKGTTTSNEVVQLKAQLEASVTKLTQQNEVLIASLQALGRGAPDAPPALAARADVAAKRDSLQAKLDDAYSQLAAYKAKFGDLPRPDFENPIREAQATIRDADEFLAKWRRGARTSVAKAEPESFATLGALIATLPSDEQMLRKKQTIAADSPRSPEEERNVTVAVTYLHAYKWNYSNDITLILGTSQSRDGGQLLLARISGLPTAGPERERLKSLRDQVKQVLERNNSYTIFSPAMQVRITGSLFYNTAHAPGVMGPKGLKPKTSWIIQPVTAIDFKR